MLGVETEFHLPEKLENLGERSLTIAGHKVQEQIRTFSQNLQISPDGTPFQPLTNKYRVAKVRAGYGDKPNLKRTGDYMREIKPRKDGEDILVGPGDDYLEIAQGLSNYREHIGIAPETPGIIEAALLEEFERTFE